MGKPVFKTNLSPVDTKKLMELAIHLEEMLNNKGDYKFNKDHTDNLWRAIGELRRK